jgi:hypothetical protein
MFFYENMRVLESYRKFKLRTTLQKPRKKALPLPVVFLALFIPYPWVCYGFEAGLKYRY